MGIIGISWDYMGVNGFLRNTQGVSWDLLHNTAIRKNSLVKQVLKESVEREVELGSSGMMCAM